MSPWRGRTGLWRRIKSLSRRGLAREERARNTRLGVREFIKGRQSMTGLIAGLVIVGAAYAIYVKRKGAEVAL